MTAKKSRTKKQSNSRPARWGRAVEQMREGTEILTELMEAHQDDPPNVVLSDDEREAVAKALSLFEDGRSDIEVLTDEYADWYDNMAESLRSGNTGQQLEAIAEIDINPSIGMDPSNAGPITMEHVDEDLGAMNEFIDECDGVEFPRMFGG